MDKEHKTKSIKDPTGVWYEEMNEIGFNDFLKTYEEKTDVKFAFSPGGSGASDHSSFYSKDIPVLFFNTGAHQDYHTPEDDIEFLNFKAEFMDEYYCTLLAIKKD